MQHHLRIEDDQPLADILQLEAHLDAFNARITGIDDARLLSIILRREDGEIYAGLHGHTWGRTCQIKLLWIARSHRRSGLGTSMLTAAEAEAVRRGCRQIILMTHSFQAPCFYKRHGFQRIATIPDNPVGHDDIVMVKQLTPGKAS